MSTPQSRVFGSGNISCKGNTEDLPSSAFSERLLSPERCAEFFVYIFYLNSSLPVARFHY